MSLDTIFGVAVHGTAIPADVAGRLATNMAAAAAALQRGAPAAMAAAARGDARRYLDARRRGDVRLPGFSARRACDEAARAVMRLTVDAPPIRHADVQLVA